MTNFEKWMKYMETFSAPRVYKEFGFYYLVSAALQRRVWTGPDHRKLFPNMYIILTGTPGVGKGLVIYPINKLIRTHLMPDPAEYVNRALPGIPKELALPERQMIESVRRTDYENAQKLEAPREGESHKNSSSDSDNLHRKEKPLLLPVAADATTYEALVKALSLSLRRKDTYQLDPVTNTQVPLLYFHSSLCFCLEEIASLFRKKTEDIVNFLIQTYDCNDYVYDTATKGKRKIKQCCLNFLGGTTPGFMQEVFDDRILSEGFASRTFFIYAQKEQKTQADIADLSEDQERYYSELEEMVLRLSNMYGQMTFSEEAKEYYNKWWYDTQDNPPNKSPKMAAYNARRNIHFKKLAMCIHAAESDSMVIELVSVIRAIDMLTEMELNAEQCLGFDTVNPIAAAAEKVLDLLVCEKCEMTYKEIYTETFSSLPGPDYRASLTEALNYLHDKRKIERSKRDNKITKEPQFYYKAAAPEKLTTAEELPSVN